MQTTTRKQTILAALLCAVIFFLLFFGCAFITKAETEGEEEEKPAVLSGLCEDPEGSGKIAYYKKGKIDTSHNGFEQLADGSDDTWYYVESGVVTGKRDDIISGTIDGKDGWFLVRESQFVKETTVAQNKYGWWYVKNGKVNFSFRGFADNEYGRWYLEKGKVNFDKYGLVKGKVSGESEDTWWYVKESKVIPTEDIIQNEYGWWYVKDGQVDFTHTGVEKNKYGWWYVREGKVNFNYTGFAKNQYGWWYVEKGQVTFNKYDIIKGKANTDPEAAREEAWWYINQSKVTDAETVAQNSYGWWYVNEGKVDFTYTGIKSNQYGDWRIVEGKVNFKCNSVIEFEGEWLYVKNGKVDHSYTGLAKKGDEWWYFSNGKRDTTFTGLAYYDGNWYYMEDGTLNWDYNGEASIPGYTRTYTVVNGKVSGALVPPTAALQKQADEILNKIGWNLRAAFDWCVMSYVRYTEDGGRGTGYYAKYGFNNHRGNCYCMAGSFVVLARELGYEAVQISGYIAGTYIHSWCEVKVNGKWYVFDPDFVVENGHGGYQINYGDRGTWIYTDYYRMGN